MKKYLKVEDVKAYQIAFVLSQDVWNIVDEWNYFAQKTIGNQYVNSTDSVSANIAEGWGRHHKKDKIKFFYNARGSAEESKDWTKKAFNRKLITEEPYEHILEQIEKLNKEINFLIYITNKKLTE